jgi:hypothetical protein
MFRYLNSGYFFNSGPDSRFRGNDEFYRARVQGKGREGT